MPKLDPGRASRDAVHWRSRALKLGLLPDDLRARTGERLEADIFGAYDTSFLDDNDLLALIAPTKVLRLAQRVRDELLGKIPELAEQIVDRADLDVDPEDNFDDLVSAVRRAEIILENDDVANRLIKDAEKGISDAIDDVRSKKQEAEHDSEYDWHWHQQK